MMNPTITTTSKPRKKRNVTMSLPPQHNGVQIGIARHDPQSLYPQMQQFLQWMREKNYSERTVGNRETYLNYFIAWCDERNLGYPQDITRPILERYQRYLYLYRKKDGQPLSTRSQSTRVVPIRAWFKWLTKNNKILYNPASDLELPRMERRLPQHILTASEVEKILNVPDINTPMGIRDRAMLETLYSTGMRRMELINLNIYDLDYERGTVMIRQGKGKKDRMIPIGERALAWIKKYTEEVRLHYSTGLDEGLLFITQQGEAFSPNRLTQMVREIINTAHINKRGSCHLFRHTMATLMLENGADIRFIQAMLGHAELTTTQIYTQVSIIKLKQIHSMTHPAKLKRQEHSQSAANPNSSQSNSEANAAELWAALEQELQQET